MKRLYKIQVERRVDASGYVNPLRCVVNTSSGEIYPIDSLIKGQDIFSPMKEVVVWIGSCPRKKLFAYTEKELLCMLDEYEKEHPTPSYKVVKSNSGDVDGEVLFRGTKVECDSYVRSLRDDMLRSHTYDVSVSYLMTCGFYAIDTEGKKYYTIHKDI